MGSTPRTSLLVFAVEPGQAVVHQQRDILLPVPERRQIKRHRAQAVQEIHAEAAAAHLLHQVAAGGGDNPGLHGDGLGAAHPLEDLGFQDPEQFDLQFQFELADFVQEQGPAFGQFKAAHLVADGPGKGAFDVAEQFRFDQGLHQGRTAEGHEGALGPGTLQVDGLGEEVLAGPRFPFQDHRRLGAGDVGQHGQQAFHGGALADDLNLSRDGGPGFPPGQGQTQGLKGFHPADNRLSFVADGGGADEEIEPASRFILDAHVLIFAGDAVFQGGFQGAPGFAAVRLKDLPAVAAHHLFRAKAGELLGRAVERGDGPPVVDDEQTPVEVLEHGAGLHPEPEVGPGRPGFGQGVIMKGQHRPDNFLVLAVERGHGIFQEPHLV